MECNNMTKEECDIKSSAVPTVSSQPQRGFFIRAQSTLRVLAIGLTVAAIVAMLTAQQSVTTDTGIVTMEARYSYSSAFKFKLGVDALVCACSVLSTMLVFLLSRSKSSNPNYYFFLFSHDLVLALLMMAGFAGATAIDVLARYGQKPSGWEPICAGVAKFCVKATLSTALSMLVLICYFLLMVMSAYKLENLATATNSK